MMWQQTIFILVLVAPSLVELSYDVCGHFNEVFCDVDTDDMEAASVTCTHEPSSGLTRITTNSLPNHPWQCVNGKGPSSIEQTYTFKEPRRQHLQNDAYCLPRGPIAITKTGVPIYNPLDEFNQDSVGKEPTDCAGGRIDFEGNYHYRHLVDNAYLYDSGDGMSQFIGVAFDGVPIYSPGDEIYEDDLDQCRGMFVYGEYRYIASLDQFPYFLGCFRAVPQIGGDFSEAKCSGMDKGSICDCEAGLLKLPSGITADNDETDPCPDDAHCGDGSDVTCVQRKEQNVNVGHIPVNKKSLLLEKLLQVLLRKKLASGNI